MSIDKNSEKLVVKLFLYIFLFYVIQALIAYVLGKDIPSSLGLNTLYLLAYFNDFKMKQWIRSFLLIVLLSFLSAYGGNDNAKMIFVAFYVSFAINLIAINLTSYLYVKVIGYKKSTAL